MVPTAEDQPLSSLRDSRASKVAAARLERATARSQSTNSQDTQLASRLFEMNCESLPTTGLNLSDLFAPDLTIIPLPDALTPIAPSMPMLETIVQAVIQKAGSTTLTSKYNALSLDERAAIVLYTMETTPRAISPCYSMNAALRGTVREAVQPWRDYIWLLLHALRKLPPINVQMVMRGCMGSPQQLGLDLTPCVLRLPNPHYAAHFAHLFASFTML